MKSWESWEKLGKLGKVGKLIFGVITNEIASSESIFGLFLFQSITKHLVSETLSTQQLCNMEVEKSWEKLGKVGRSWEKLGKVGKVGKVGKSWEKLGKSIFGVINQTLNEIASSEFIFELFLFQSNTKHLVSETISAKLGKVGRSWGKLGKFGKSMFEITVI